MSRSLWLVVAVLAALALVAGCASSGDIASESSESSEEAADYFYEIPPGAGEALDAGTSLEILPARLDAEVGQVIEIRNDDERGHLVGPFFVGAGETLRQRFSSPGEFIGECTVHPSGQITVVVS